jgi:protocatechuate 4,5-dioxygenase alpha chain
MMKHLFIEIKALVRMWLFECAVGASPAMLTNAANDIAPGTTFIQQEPRVSEYPPIPGTTLFDGSQARKGYALNKMCFSFNSAACREEFVRDEEAYMHKYGLNEEQAAGIRGRDVLGLIRAGGNAYYLAKFAGILGLNMQDIGALQTGMTVDEFKAKLKAYA